jgi:predicted PurR-regulated permease PerM
MSGWDILNELIKNLPPIVAILFFVVAGVILAVGFSRHGMNFIKYGFRQTLLDNSLDKRFDAIEKRFEAFDKRFDKLETRIDGLQVELETIKTNHFGHLKNYLTELTSILLDKGVINNENKARLDNQLRGM